MAYLKGAILALIWKTEENHGNLSQRGYTASNEMVR
jgi:hypothetical protein